MSVLSLIQRMCERVNVPSPSTVLGSSDDQVKQLKALLEEEGNDLASRGSWEALTQEASHTTLAAEDQGTISSIASNGFRYVKNQTIWDRTDMLPITGPMDGSEWQSMKARVNTGPRYQYRIRGGKLLVNPAPVAGHDWRFEYISKYWIIGVDGTSYRNYFTLDTDELLLPEELLLMGLRWRWLREQGLDYAELFRTYEAQVKDALGRDGSKPILRMDEGGGGPQPRVYAPPGSWSL